jgi:hypothetical protein
MKTFKLDSEKNISSGFKTPDDYFDTFSDKILQKIAEQPAPKEIKVISIFRKRKNILIAVAAVLVLALMIPVFYQSNSPHSELDTATLENYLAEETNMNQYEIIEETEFEKTNFIALETSLEDETLEDMLVSYPNIENLIIED